jgi:hypothetical protein
MQLLVTEATGKVCVNLVERLLSDLRWRAHVLGRCVTAAPSRRPIELSLSKEPLKTAIASIAQCAT